MYFKKLCNYTYFLVNCIESLANHSTKAGLNVECSNYLTCYENIM